MFPEPVFSEIPRLDLRVIPAEHPPLPGQALIGYMIYDTPSSCFVSPRPDRMNGIGWLSVIGLSILFWPTMCVPCCLGGCYDGFQIPVYE